MMPQLAEKPVLRRHPAVSMGARLKIGLLTDNYPDSGGAGGIGTYSKIVVEELARLGHDAHVFTPASVKQLTVRRINGVTIWECPDWSKRRQMPPVQALEFTLRYRARAEILGRYSLAVAVRQACRAGAFDVLESPEIGALGSLVAARKYTRRFAVRLHKPSNLPFKYGQIEGEGPWSPINDWERDLARQADVVTAPTADARSAIADFWNEPLEHVRIVGSPVRFAPMSDGESRGVCSAVYFGRFEPRKGVDTLASAIGLVRKRFPQFTVTFIGGDNRWPGGGTGAETIARITSESGVVDAYRLLPPMPHEQLLPVVQSATVCVLPSRAETFGVAFTEAMMWGVPCVVSDIGPFRELAEDGVHCFFADPERPDIFADRICWLLGDRQLAGDMTRQAHGHVRQWTPERLVPRLIEAWLS